MGSVIRSIQRNKQRSVITDHTREVRRIRKNFMRTGSLRND